MLFRLSRRSYAAAVIGHKAQGAGGLVSKLGPPDGQKLSGRILHQSWLESSTNTSLPGRSYSDALKFNFLPPTQVVSTFRPSYVQFSCVNVRLRSSTAEELRFKRTECLLFVGHLQVTWAQKIVASGRRCARGPTAALNAVDEKFAAYSHLTIQPPVPNASHAAHDASIKNMPTVM